MHGYLSLGLAITLALGLTGNALADSDHGHPDHKSHGHKGHGHGHEDRGHDDVHEGHDHGHGHAYGREHHSRRWDDGRTGVAWFGHSRGAFSTRTGDVWINYRMGEINTYGVRYREPFVNEIVTYYGAPRPFVIELLGSRRWAPADVYYACAFAHSIGRPCDEVVARYEHSRAGGWIAVEQSYGIQPTSAQFVVFKRGFAASYGRWGHPVSIASNEPVNWRALPLVAPVAVAVRAPSVAVASSAYSVHTGDAWVDNRMVEVNDYGVHYREPFVNEMVTYYGAPRPLMADLLVTRHWKPGDVYYACAFAHSIGRPCSEVVDRYERNHGGGWDAVTLSYGVRPGSQQFRTFKGGFVQTYGRWSHTVAINRQEHVRWDGPVVHAGGRDMHQHGNGHAYGRDHHKGHRGTRVHGPDREHEMHDHDDHDNGHEKRHEKDHDNDHKNKHGDKHDRH